MQDEGTAVVAAEVEADAVEASEIDFKDDVVETEEAAVVEFNVGTKEAEDRVAFEDDDTVAADVELDLAPDGLELELAGNAGAERDRDELADTPDGLDDALLRTSPLDRYSAIVFHCPQFCEALPGHCVGQNERGTRTDALPRALPHQHCLVFVNPESAKPFAVQVDRQLSTVWESDQTPKPCRAFGFVSDQHPM